MHDAEPAGRGSLVGPALLATAGAVGAAVTVIALTGGDGARPTGGPLTPVPVTAPADQDPATREACARLGARLPVEVGPDLRARGTDPVDPGLAAWGDPAVVLRCGVRTPVGASAGDVSVNDVRWDARPRGATTRYYLLDRSVTVEVTVPGEHEGGPVLTDLAAAVQAALPTP